MSTPTARARQLNPAKLLRSKWTACVPGGREKHFIVTALISEPGTAPAAQPIVRQVVMEAVLTRRQQTLAWQALRDGAVWAQGWL